MKIVFIILLVLSIAGSIAYAQVQVNNQESIISPSGDDLARKEFIYCPQTNVLNTVHYLNGTALSTTIEGCPSSRLYINDWNSISPLDQQTIKTQLLANGWKEG